MDLRKILLESNEIIITVTSSSVNEPYILQSS